MIELINYLVFQEASWWVLEVFFHQFHVGFFQVVLLRDTGLRIRSVSYLWIASLEANVCMILSLLGSGC